MTSSPHLSISRDKIRAVYAQGEASVIALVEGLVAQINTLENLMICAALRFIVQHLLFDGDRITSTPQICNAKF